MKLLVAAATCVALLLSAPVLAQNKKKVLIIASNMVDMGDADRHDARNNLWEVAPPYHIFLTHGFDVDFVSPQGGAVPFMMDPLGISSYTIKYENFLVKSNNSMTPKQVNPNDYWGIYIGGGYGPIFDVASDSDTQALIGKVYEAGGIVGSGGHGAAGFANVKLANGEHLVHGKKVAAFPNSTEVTKSWAKQGTLLPFLVEDQLNKNGAYAQNKQTLSDKTQVVIDQRIVSTMFLPSAANVAKEMIELYRSKQ